MLSARTAEIDLEAFEAAPDIVVNRDIHHIVYAVQEFRHPGLLFEKIFYGFVAARLRLELRQPARVEDGSAVEDKAAAVPAFSASLDRWPDPGLERRARALQLFAELRKQHG